MTAALVSIAAAGQRLSVSRRTIYRLVDDGRLPLVKVRGRSMVPADALEAFIGEVLKEGVSRDRTPAA